MQERNAILELWNECPQAALATVVEVRGSAYRRPGARMLLTADGRSAGMINGGCLDNDLWRLAREVMDADAAQLAYYDTTSPDDIVWGLGLGCRGVVKILVEPAHDLSWLHDNQTVAVHYEGEALGTRLWTETVPERPRIVETPAGETPTGRAFVESLAPRQRLVIFGAGADTVPLFGMAQVLGWQIEVIDPRAPHPERATYLPAQHLAPIELPGFAIAPGAACVVMTHNFLHDLEILRFLLPSPARYIGILGPRHRTEELIEALPKRGILPGLTPTPEQLDKLHAPVGLDLGGETPEEIALAVVAEIQRTRHQKSGQSLRERDFIH